MIKGESDEGEKSSSYALIKIDTILVMERTIRYSSTIWDGKSYWPMRILNYKSELPQLFELFP